MLRTIAVIMALLLCVLAGNRAAEKLRRRSAVLLEIHADVQRIRLGLTHTNRPVHALLSECGGRETQAVFLGMARDVEKGDTPLFAWRKAMEQGDGAFTALTEDDRKVLTVFFSLLGGSDRFSQLQHADATLKALARQCTQARQAYEKNGRICRTMGVLLGAGIAILML